MNWIIRNTKKFEFHTYLDEILKPISDDIENFNWILSDLDFMTDKSLPINFDEDYFILSNEDFKKITYSRPQIIWGVISAIPKSFTVEIDTENLPFVEGNDLIWENGNLQVKNSEIEIIAFDSSYTIVKFTNQSLSEKFRNYFDEAIELDKFK